MKSQIRFIVLVILMVLAEGKIFSQFTLSGEVRPRGEYSHGYATLAGLGQDPSFFISQRTRLNFLYQQERLKTGLVLQDVRIWGSQPQLVSNEDFATSVHQAWLQYEFLENFFLKAGRQELVYDNHRIFGNVGWAQQARSHDLVLFKYDGDFRIHAGLAYHENSNRRNNFYFGPDAYKAMQFLWTHKEFDDLELSLLFLNNGIPVTRETTPFGEIEEQGISYNQTFGPYARYSLDDAGIILAAYYQGGKDGNEDKLRAWYGNVESFLDWTDELTTSIGYEFLSGTSYEEGEVNHSFTPFYGTNHKFNGFMDYFYVGNHINSVGLGDLYLKGTYTPGDFSFGADLHVFHAAAEIGPDVSSYLGTEIDLTAGWSVDENVDLNIGYSQLYPGESMEILKGGEKEVTQNWAWIMITVKPDFFTIGEGREQIIIAD